MAITKNTFSISPTWTDDDLITQMQSAFSWAGQHGGADSGQVVGVSTWTVPVANGSGDETFWTAKQSATSGVGTDAEFMIRKTGGNIYAVNVNSCGAGYTGGEVVTIPASEFNGSADLDVTVAIAATVSNAVSYACTLTSDYVVAGEDRNGAVQSSSGVSTTITIKEGDTLNLTCNNQSWSLNVHLCGPGISSNTTANQYNKTFNFQAYYSESGNSGNIVSWTPLPGQAGEYYIRDDSGSYSYAPRIVVEPCTYSDINVISTGSSTTFYDSSLVGVGTTATYPYGVLKHVIDETKDYGTTFRTVSPRNSNGDVGKDFLYFWAGPRYFPHQYQTADGLQYMDYGGHGFGMRYAGEPNLDTPYGYDMWSSTLRMYSSTTADQYAQNEDYKIPTGSNTGYQLDLNVYRSSLDPNFVVYSYKAPTLSSTHLNSNTFGTWFFHDFTSSLWDLDDQFLGGLTQLYIPYSGSTNSPIIRMITHPIGMVYDYSSSIGRGPTKRGAEFGYLQFDPVNSYVNKYRYTDYRSTTHENYDNLTDVSIYYRNRIDAPVRSNNQFTGTGQTDEKLMPSSTDFNAVIKGIPLQAKFLPMPYYIPDDFVFIDFNYGTPSANIQQGDTVTVSGSEVYTVITGSYNQSGRTRGLLFCARTT